MPPAIRQTAALPVRDGLICVVSSRNGRRWVIPKGRIDRGHTAAESALVEAWEEAGLTGVLDPEPVGSYHYEKYGLDHHVTVFVMRVSQEAASFPEKGMRTKEWVSAEEAMLRMNEMGLRTIIRTVCGVTVTEEETIITDQ